jgi:hypothetical protein
MRASFAVFSLLLLAACSSDPAATAQVGAKISLKYSADTLPQASEDAARQCAAHGRTAKLRESDQAGDQKTVVFDCM